MEYPDGHLVTSQQVGDPLGSEPGEPVLVRDPDNVELAGSGLGHHAVESWS